MTDDARLGPDDLVGRHFTMVLRGYDRHQVDEFLFRAATSWRAALAGPSIVAPAVQEPTGGNGPAPPVTFDPSARPVEAQEADETGESGEAVPDLPRRERTLTDLVAPGGVSNGKKPEKTGADVDVDEGPIPDADATTAPDDAEEPASDATPTQAEIARDRTAAFAERKAAELDRATARIELARAQEEALRIVDGAQRRAESVLIGTRDRARLIAEAVLSEARARVGPLLEQERTTRVSLTRLSHDIGVVAAAGSGDLTPALPDAGELVTAAENDPDTPPTPFPIDIDSAPDDPEI